MIMIIIAVVVVLILLWVISTYNKFVKLQNKVISLCQVDTQNN